jgi:Zn-dependent M28 family amino/carboxypeptidase
VDNPDEKEDLHLLEFVTALENKSNLARCQQVQNILISSGLKPLIQECHFPKIKNIVVDFSSESTGKTLLFSAHYDAVKGSPGANDNASGVAVLLGLCRKLKQLRAPIRVIFFDREEAWFRVPFLRLGLLGSFHYVLHNNLSNVEGVYNLEYCGQGDFLSVWPVRTKERDTLAVKCVEKAAADLTVDLKLAHIPWLLLSSDHLPFRIRGITNSVTLTLLPSSQLPALERLISSLKITVLLSGKKPTLPQPLALIHTNGDTSSRLNENSLRVMLSLLLEIVKIHSNKKTIKQGVGNKD